MIDDAIVPSPIDEVKIRVYDGNNDASNSQVECTLERWYMNRSTGSVTFDEDDTDQTSTTGTGNDTLNPILSNQPNDSTNAYYYNVVCTLPGNDVLTSKVWAILAEWDGA